MKLAMVRNNFEYFHVYNGNTRKQNDKIGAKGEKLMLKTTT